MYCSGCGSEVESGLNFCKRCGTRVGPAQTSSVAENLSSALGYIGGFGLLGFIFVLYLMLRSATISQGTIMLVSLVYLGTLLAICFLILRQTSPFTIGARAKPQQEEAVSMPAYLKPVTTAQLRATTEEPVSVAEHTTRTLEEVPRASTDRPDRG